MSSHLHDFQLQAFGRGELNDAEAVSAAMHLDECPQCAARVATLDPFGPVFAQIVAPRAPKDLVARALQAADVPEIVEEPVWVEVGLGAVLLVAAAFLVLLGGDALKAMVEIGLFADVLARFSSPWIPSMTPMLLVAILAGSAALFAIRRVRSGQALGPRWS